MSLAPAKVTGAEGEREAEAAREEISHLAEARQ